MRLDSNNRFALTVAGLLILLNVVYVSLSTGFIHPPETVLETDHYRYLEMAGGPELYARSQLAHEPPFCFRLLTPFLAFLLTAAGLGLNLSFYLLTNLFLFGYLFVFYLYLRRTDLNFALALTGMALAGLTPGAVRWYEYQYWMTDPAGLFFVLLAFLLIETEKDAYLLPLGALAVANRETYLAVIPYYFLRRWKSSGGKAAALRTLGVLLPSLLVLGLIRYYVIPSGSYRPTATIKEILAFRREFLWRNQIYLWTVGSFGVVFPLSLLFPGRLIRFCRNHYDQLLFLILIYASLALANNTDRLLAYALPVFLWAALKNLQKFISLARLPSRPLLAAVIALQLFFYLSVKFYRQPAISVFQPANPVVALICFLFWLFGQVRLLSCRRRRD